MSGISMNQIEAILLTGGASRRMGADKAGITVQREPLAARIARLLAERGVPVTVCGRDPIEGHGFMRDAEEYAGPLVALAGFVPSHEFVFVVSCDLPRFETAVVDLLLARIGSQDAAIPIVGDRAQPLCALYRAQSLTIAGSLVQSGERRVMSWVGRLDLVLVPEIEPAWVANVNTPEELRALGFDL